MMFTFLFSTTSWGEWTYVTKSVDGHKFYYEKDRVRKSGKYIYLWGLTDLLKPSPYGDSSYTVYTQLDCSIFRFKDLKSIYYKKSMGEGEITAEGTPKDEWSYPKPGSVIEKFYNKVCEENQ